MSDVAGSQDYFLQDYDSQVESDDDEDTQGRPERDKSNSNDFDDMRDDQKVATFEIESLRLDERRSVDAAMDAGVYNKRDYLAILNEELQNSADTARRPENEEARVHFGESVAAAENDRQQSLPPSANDDSFVVASENGFSVKGEGELLAQNHSLSEGQPTEATEDNDEEEEERLLDAASKHGRRATPYKISVPARLSLPRSELNPLDEEESPATPTPSLTEKSKVLRFDETIGPDKPGSSLHRARRATPAALHVPPRDVDESSSQSDDDSVDEKRELFIKEYREYKKQKDVLTLSRRQEVQRARPNSAKLSEKTDSANSRHNAELRMQSQRVLLEQKELKLKEMQNENALNLWKKSLEKREKANRQRLLTHQEFMRRVAEKKQLDRLERQNQLKLLRKNEHDAKLQRARQLRLAEQQREAQADQVIELWLKKRAEREVEAAYEQAMRTERAQLLQARLKREAEQREADRKERESRERAERVKLRHEKAEADRERQQVNDIYRKWWADKSKQIEYERRLEEERQKDLGNVEPTEEEKRERKAQSERAFEEWKQKKQEEAEREREMEEFRQKVEKIALRLQRREKTLGKTALRARHLDYYGYRF